MSAFVSMASPAGIALLTDGAVNSGRILIEDRRKVLVGGGVAITTRGQAKFGFEVAERFCKFAKQVGAARAIDAVGDFAATMRAEYGVLAGELATEFLVAACVPGKGGVHRFFQTEAITINATGAVLPAYDVVAPGSLIMRGAPPTGPELHAKGLLPAAGEGLAAWARRGGLGIMQTMRERPGVAVGVTGVVSGIGGHVDLTLITAAGLTVECIHDWRDTIGERIDPFRKPPGWAVLAA
jgi:hypothetical protein